MWAPFRKKSACIPGICARIVPEPKQHELSARSLTLKHRPEPPAPATVAQSGSTPYTAVLPESASTPGDWAVESAPGHVATQTGWLKLTSGLVLGPSAGRVGEARTLASGRKPKMRRPLAL